VSRHPALWSAVAFAVAAGLAIGYAAGGTGGLVVAGTVLALLAMLGARVTIPRGRRQARAVKKKHLSTHEDEAAFRSYMEISSDVSWSGASARHYDHGIRRLLTRLVTTRLAESHGVDAVRQPARARALVGEDVWPLVDPSIRPSQDSDAPGVSLERLARVVTRLEEL
jgi:hypothetical protein